jgi:hypothetical protein
VNSEPEDQLDRIRSEIRADAETARQRAPLPVRDIVVTAADVRDAGSNAGRVTIAELASLAGPTFVDQAFRRILKREPDPVGFEQQMAALGAGASKIEVLGDLRFSAEGRRAGIAIPGLAPRYFVGKLGRVPILGALVRWLIALASLPHILRYQRATEASLAVQFGEIRAALHAGEQRDAEQREMLNAASISIGQLSDSIGELSERLGRVETYARGLDAAVTELRGLTLAMNHWAVQIRQCIDAIEAAEGERRTREDETAAVLIERMQDLDVERAQRVGAWSNELARRLPGKGRVLDICGDPQWFDALAGSGWSASAIETNSVLHRRARDERRDVTLGDPLALMARIADASLDALSFASDRVLEDASASELLREAMRIVRPGGMLLIDAGQSTRSAEATLSRTARACGFAGPDAIDAASGHALLFVRP